MKQVPVSLEIESILRLTIERHMFRKLLLFHLVRSALDRLVGGVSLFTRRIKHEK